MGRTQKRKTLNSAVWDELEPASVQELGMKTFVFIQDFVILIYDKIYETVQNLI